MAQLPFTPLQPYGVPGQTGQLGGLSLSNFTAFVKTISASSYTLQPTDSGALIKVNATSTCTITFPSFLPEGFNCLIFKAGSGNVAFNFAAGVTQLSNIAGVFELYGYASVLVPDNTTGASPAVLIGSSAAATGSDSAPQNIGPPTITGTAQEGGTLIVVSGAWTNSPLTYSFQWRRAGADISGATSSQYTVTSADIAQSITCVVTAANQFGSTAAESAPIVPSTSGAPTNTTKPSITGTAAVGSTLQSSQGVWTGAPTDFTYQWNRGASPISGATAASYVVQSADLTYTITVTVTATNTFGSAAATSNPTSTVGAAVPVNTVLPVISGTVQEGSVLTVTTGTWSGTPTAYAYQWTRDGSNISSATNASYTLVTADATHLVACVVTASNAAGSGTATANSVGPVTATGSAPANITKPIISGTASVGSVLSTTNGTWANTPSSYTYQWKRNGTNIASATASTYTLVSGDSGNTITVTVTATNGSGSGSATSDPTGTVVTGAPVNTVAPSISPSTGLVVGTLLTVNTGTWTGAPSFTYQWKADGTNISAATSSTYTLTSGEVAKTITCAVTGTNGSGNATATTSGVGPVSASSTLLLDAVTGTPAAAFSTRKLRAAYAGSCLKVRRSSDNTTQDIGFDGSGNLDTTALTTFVGANNGFIDTWYDQSGNGYNLISLGTGSQPQIVASGTVITRNGRACPLFDTGQGLRNTTSLDSFNNSLAVIFQRKNAGIFAYIAASYLTGRVPMFLDTTNKLGQYDGGATGTGSTTWDLATNLGQISYSRNNGAWVNGAADAGTAAGGGFNMKFDSIGLSNVSASNDVQGYVGEFVYWTSNNLSQRTTWEANQKSYWGTP